MEKLSTISFGFARPVAELVARAPVNSVFALVLVSGLGWAAANALLWQGGVHPAPLFPNAGALAETGHVEDVAPAPERPEPVAAGDAQVASISQLLVDRGFATGNRDIFLVQSRLHELGFFDGEVDGYYGPRTASAIRAFESENGLASVGAISDSLIAALNVNLVPNRPGSESLSGSAKNNTPDRLLQIATLTADNLNIVEPNHADLVAKVQRGLSSLGYDVGKIDGIAGAETSRAIRRFENFYNYRQTGQVSDELVDMLKAANAKF